MKEKEENRGISVADTQRLQKTFFSSPPASFQKPQKKNYLFIAFLLFLVGGGITIFGRYRVILLPHLPLQNENVLRLLDKNNLKSLSFIGKDTEHYRFYSPIIFLPLKGKKGGFDLQFRKPMDFRNNYLLLYCKNPQTEFTVWTIMRDKHYFSNSRRPLKIKVMPKDKDNPYIVVSIDLQKMMNSRINLSQIETLRLYFFISPRDNKRNELLVKDLVLVRKD